MEKEIVCNMLDCHDWPEPIDYISIMCIKLLAGH